MLVQEIKKRFIEFHEENGFQIHQSFPLVINDPTILFTNSTVAPFKKMFTGELEQKNFALIQECLRIGGSAGNLETPRKNLNFTSIFEMLGSGFFDFTEINAVKYFIDLLIYLGIPKEQLHLSAIEKYGFIESLKNIGYPENQIHSLPTNSTITHEWSFGEGDLHGYGLIAWYNPSPDQTVLESYIQLGRLVHLDGITINNNVIQNKFCSYDVGIGLNRIEIALNGNCEECLSSWRKYAKIFESSISDLSPGDAHYLANLFYIIETLINEGLRPGKKRQASVLKKLIRLLIEEIWVQEKELAYLSSILENLFHSLDNPETIQETLLQQETLLRKIMVNANKKKRKFPEMSEDELKSTFGIRPRLFFLI